MEILAYGLINTKPGKCTQVLEKVKEFPCVEKAHMVTGTYDIIVLLNSKDLQTLGEITTEKIHKIDGVRTTATCIVIT